MTDYVSFSENDFREAFDEFYKLLTDGKRPVNSPKAFLLGDQSGAGKTTIHDIIQKANTNFIVIDGDRFRERHPIFEAIHKIYGNNAANYTQKFSNRYVAHFSFSEQKFFKNMVDKLR